MKTTQFSVEGMHCGGCVDAVKALLCSEPGVHGVEVSLEGRYVRVLFDPAKNDETRLAAAIEKPGYRMTRDA